MFEYFWCEKSLSRHQEYCNEYEAVKIELPEKGTMLKHKNYHRSEKVPFIVYADFECYIKPIQSCNPDDKKSILSNTKNTNHLAFVTISNALMMRYINQN